MIIPSLYSYDTNMKISETTIKTKPQNNIPAPGEKVVIAVLRKYGFLTSSLLQRAINVKNHRSLKVTSSLRKMQQQGKVLKYTITHDIDIQDIDVYVLSKEERSNSGFKSIFRYDMTDIPYILEHLSITQWHIAMLEGELTKEVMLYRQIHLKDSISQVPSMVEYKPPFGKKLYICGISVPKGKHKDDFGAFLTRIISIDEYLKDHNESFRAYVIVIICESESQIEELSKFLSNMAETSELYLMYTIDALTAEDVLDPLSVLYDVERHEGETSLNVIRIRG